MNRRCRVGAYSLLLWAALCPSVPGAQAAQPARPEYDRDVAACNDGRPDDQKAACLREAAAAQAERARGVLGDDDRQLRENARRRCDPLPEDQKADCLMRVGGEGKVEGSVREGAIIRETITTDSAVQGPPPVVPVVIDPGAK